MINFNSITEQIEKSGGYKTTFGNFNSFEEAKNALSGMLAPEGEIRNVLKELDDSIGLHNLELDIHPTKSDEGFCISFSVSKPKKMGM